MKDMLATLIQSQVKSDQEILVLQQGQQILQQGQQTLQQEYQSLQQGMAKIELQMGQMAKELGERPKGALPYPLMWSITQSLRPKSKTMLCLHHILVSLMLPTLLLPQSLMFSSFLLSF